MTNHSQRSTKVQYKIGAYVRLSPSDEIREEGSLVSHPQRIKSYVDFKNVQQPAWGEIVEWYTDKDLSGKDLNRPALMQLLQDVKYGKVNAVIVTELSRLSRDVKDFCQCWEFLKQHNATFFSLKENFDTSTPIGEMMVIQCISFAQFERKTIIARIKDGSRARAERGLSSGNMRALGLDIDPIKRCHLMVNEQEAIIVRHIFEQFTELGCVSKLREYLNNNGYRTKAFITKNGRQVGGELWSDSSLHHLLTNLSYIGKREINRRNRGIEPEELLEADRYKIVQAAWPAIVEETLFNRIQEMLQFNYRFLRVHKHIYRLSGLVICSGCGEELVGKSANGKGGKYFYYGHNRKFASQDHNRSQRRCPLERIPAEKLEEAIVNRMIQLASDKKLLIQLAHDSSQGQEVNHQEIDSLLATHEQEKRNVTRQIENLISVLADKPEGLNTQPIFAKIADLGQRQEQIKEAVALLKKQRGQSNVINVEHVLKVFRSFQKNFLEKSAHQQRDILKDIIYRILVVQDGAEIISYGSKRPDSIKLDIEGRSDFLSCIESIGGTKKDGLAGAEPSVLASLSSGVRPENKMVDLTRIELATSTMPSLKIAFSQIRENAQKIN